MIRLYPHHGLEQWLILQTFYKGLTHQTRAYVDSAAGGGIMNKTLEEAFELIESMASHHFQWSSDRTVVPQAPGIISLSSTDALAAKVDMLSRQIAGIMSGSGASSIASVQSTQPVCEICGIAGHLNGECTFYAVVGPYVSEVNYAQGQSHYGGAFSQSYNPSWKNHPHLSYKNNQGPNSFVGGQSSVGTKPIMQLSNYNFQRQQEVSSNENSRLEEMFKMQFDAFIGMRQEIKELTNSIKGNSVINEAN
jgi:hypothetical protein